MNLKDFNTAQSLVGKNVHFTATCDFFPQQGIFGKVARIEYAKNGELVYIIRTPKQGLEFSVGCNTKGLDVTVR